MGQPPGREGITTGTCAAAAARAAALALNQSKTLDNVSIFLPLGKQITVNIAHVFFQKDWARAKVVKYAGADRDITDSAEIIVTVRRTCSAGILIKGGTGVGTVTLDGLQVPVGQPAINPVPRRMIEQSVAGLVPDEGGLEIEVSVPRGEELAKKTYNPRLGIVGGISILGTTGIVRPMCKEALLCSLLPALSVARANGIEEVYLVPGNIGRSAVQARFKPPQLAVVEISNYAGIMLEQAVKHHFKRLVLAGHPGKLAKLISGHFCTDSAVSPSAVTAVMEIARKNGLTKDYLNSQDPVTVERIITCLPHSVRKELFDSVAKAIRDAAAQRYRISNLGIWLCDMKGREVGACGI